jgi:hypothetical protein
MLSANQIINQMNDKYNPDYIFTIHDSINNGFVEIRVSDVHQDKMMISNYKINTLNRKKRYDDRIS